MTCVGCGKKSTSYEARVYFGVTGPFCDVACREAWLKREMERLDADEVTIGGFTPDELLAIESGLEMFVKCRSPAVDPNEVLKRARGLAEKIIEAADADLKPDEDALSKDQRMHERAVELAEAFQALDTWITCGGFPPRGWGRKPDKETP